MHTLKRLGMAAVAAVGLLFVAGMPVQNSITVVANLTALQGTPVAAAYSGVLERVTDGTAGAPQMSFLPGEGTCSSAGLVNDGASCVNSSDGNHWAGVLSGPDVRQWGVVMNGTTDNHTTLQAALTWLGTTGGKLSFPAGTVYSSANVSVTPPTTHSITIQGAGADATLWKGPTTGNVNFLTINESTAYQSFHLRDFSCVAAGAASTQGTCIQLVQSGAIASPGNTAQSDISNVTIRGADTYAGSDCWAVGIDTGYTSNINFINDNVTGCNTPSPAGVGVKLSGNATYNGVVYNFIGSTFNYLADGITLGNGIQGVTVNQSNLIGDTVGINVPASLATTGQLTVTNSSFGDGIAIDDQTGVPYAVYSGNYVVIPAASDTGFDLGLCNNCISMGNKFLGQSTSSTTGLFIAGTGVSVGDLFSGSATGIDLAGSSAISVRTPIFSGNTTNVTSTCANCTVSGVTLAGVQYPIIAVTGAVDNGSPLHQVKLTVSSTTNLVNNEVVSVSGVGGVGSIATQANTPITIVDSTHILLTTIAFSGTYTSGGLVTALP